MAFPSATTIGVLLLVLLVASSPSPLQARSMPGDGVHRDRPAQDAEMTRSSAAGSTSSWLKELLLVQRPPLPLTPPPPPPPTNAVITARSRKLGSVPSPGVGH
ncbi:hypothetical protein GUJ93_ZPchr0001g31626 [Zizania palustris]|uniref:Uncharacterized protein n=1 Tax=Zizania palustris TaxID=103762 RepID=A0A8J5VSP8_ZIZPA|nr:hypothetical protein GUJ93_ZPchr0001g31626 [Zizania palustris]